MTQDEIYFTACAMDAFGGHFAGHLSDALLAADAGNQKRIIEAFPELMVKYGPGSDYFAQVYFEQRHEHYEPQGSPTGRAPLRHEPMPELPGSPTGRAASEPELQNFPESPSLRKVGEAVKDMNYAKLELRCLASMAGMPGNAPGSATLTLEQNLQQIPKGSSVPQALQQELLKVMPEWRLITTDCGEVVSNEPANLSRAQIQDLYRKLASNELGEISLDTWTSGSRDPLANALDIVCKPENYGGTE